MPRNKGGLWEAMKAGKFWHEPEPKPDPKPEPAPEQPKKTKPKSAMAKKILEAKAKKEKDVPNQENHLEANSPKVTNPFPKEDNPGPCKIPSVNKPYSYRPEPEEKKIDIPFNHPNRPSQTSIEGRGRKKAIPNGKVLDLDLWEGDTTEIYPKITVMPHGLRFIGTHEEFMRLANKLLSS